MVHNKYMYEQTLKKKSLGDCSLHSSIQFMNIVVVVAAYLNMVTKCVNNRLCMQVTDTAFVGSEHAQSLNSLSFDGHRC